MHFCAKGFHHDSAVRLLIVAYANHVHDAFQAEEIARHGQGAAPLPGTCFRGYAFRPCLFVVIHLCDGGVQLVAACRARALIFVENLCGRLECLFEPKRPDQRGGAIHPVKGQHLLRDGDFPFSTDFLFDDIHREYRAECLRRNRFARCRVARWRRFVRHVGDDVIPAPRHLSLTQVNLHLFHCFFLHFFVVWRRRKGPRAVDVLMFGIRFDRTTRACDEQDCPAKPGLRA
ncbi:MAG: hypothetical protein BWY06_02421 [Candidatus Latescibacteria bacterium ADurb.Bin168]|nr:MAG: hypothetical protein BWY06_02421 [Candidatus Latescibacteria bacterium ADurb.Bin168]